MRWKKECVYVCVCFYGSFQMWLKKTATTTTAKQNDIKSLILDKDGRSERAREKEQASMKKQ